MSIKKNLLLIFGVGDAYCSKDSNRFLKAGEKILAETAKLVQDKGNTFAGYINALEFGDIDHPKTNIFDGVESTKIIDLKLLNDTPLDDDNIIYLPTHDKDNMLFSADNFSFLFPSDKYNLFICGVDIKGCFVNLIDSLIVEGYNITVYSNIIKPFNKDTITYIIEKSQSRNNKLRFCKS